MAECEIIIDIVDLQVAYVVDIVDLPVGYVVDIVDECAIVIPITESYPYSYPLAYGT